MKFIYFLTAILLLASCSEERETTKPKHELMIEAVYSSVTIQPNQEYKVNASIAGYLDEVKVKEGNKVKLGDVLFVISNKPIQLNQQNAELALEFLKDSYQGQANVIDEMKLSLKTAKVKMQNDSLNFKRFSALFQSGACAKSELDNASLAYEASKNSYASLKTQIQRKELELKNQLNQSKNNVDASASKTGDYIIHSNINGKIFQLNKEKGEFVSMQETIAIVGDGSQFSIDMLIDEVDISKVPAKKLALKSNEEIEHDAMEKLRLLGIDDQALKISSRISGGQKQRVAIARALINHPTIIMGDEPTGNLDSKNTNIVFDIFRELATEQNLSLLVVTHDDDFAKRTDRIIMMEDGRIV